jgi:hypothetical protein
MLLLLIFLFLASPAWAQKVDDGTLVTEEVSTGTKPIPAGTTVNPSFAIPAQSTGAFAVTVDCDPTATITVTIERASDGALLGKFTRTPGPCVDMRGKPLTTIGAIWNRKQLKNDLLFVPGTTIQTKITTDTPLTTDMKAIFEKKQ